MFVFKIVAVHLIKDIAPLCCYEKKIRITLREFKYNVVINYSKQKNLRFYRHNF